MPFQYFQPHITLTDYIQCYWILTGKDDIMDVLLPDGCVDVIANVGITFFVEEKDTVLETDKIYLGGALTEAISAIVPEGVKLLGVRFHPGCFAHFYPVLRLSSIANACINVPTDYFPELKNSMADPVPALNTFYLKKLRQFHNPVSHPIRKIIDSNGNCTIKQIANLSFTTCRQLERKFKEYVGLSPKQFSSVLKFNYAHSRIESKKNTETLLDIALEAGYYDHAHFCKEFKKVTKRNPSNH